MKQKLKSAALVFVALLLTAVGGIRAIQLLQQYDRLLHALPANGALLSPLHQTALQILFCGGLIVTGLSLLIFLLLWFFNRSRREMAALQEKNRMMERIHQQTQDLAHHQRLETIGTLTSSISHEFNNLLTPIMGYSLMALEKLPPEEEELYDNILEIYNASRKAKTIISRLSDLSRKNTDDTFRPVSPDEIVQKTLDVAAPAKPEQVEIHLSLDCWDQRMKANEIQLSQLVLNLVLNGFHAMEDGPGVLTLQTWFDETHVHLMVSDTGCGMDADTKKKMFDPFFTTRESGKGTGLGLAIVQQVVEDHKGSIQVDSHPGEGTAITISLPRN